MIKVTLKYDHHTENPIIMEVLLKNNITIQKTGIGFGNYYVTCIFKDENQLNQILLILAQRHVVIAVKHKHKLFNFKEFWKNLK